MPERGRVGEEGERRREGEAERESRPLINLRDGEERELKCEGGGEGRSELVREMKIHTKSIVLRSILKIRYKIGCQITDFKKAEDGCHNMSLRSQLTIDTKLGLSSHHVQGLG